VTDEPCHMRMFLAQDRRAIVIRFYRDPREHEDCYFDEIAIPLTAKRALELAGMLSAYAVRTWIARA
jgi:hypothetical protein